MWNAILRMQNKSEIKFTFPLLTLSLQVMGILDFYWNREIVLKSVAPERAIWEDGFSLIAVPTSVTP